MHSIFQNRKNPASVWAARLFRVQGRFYVGAGGTCKAVDDVMMSSRNIQLYSPYMMVDKE